MNGSTYGKPIFYILNSMYLWCLLYCVFFNCPFHSMKSCCYFFLCPIIQYNNTNCYFIYSMTNCCKLIVWIKTAILLLYGLRALCCQLLTMPLVTYKLFMLFTRIPAIFIIHIIWHLLHSHIHYCCLYYNKWGESTEPQFNCAMPLPG